MSGNVWVIEQGSYSDYRVVGVFSSRANAQLVADAINRGDDYGDAATVAKWDLDPAVEHINAGRRPFVLCMAYDGTVERVEPYEISGYELAGSLSVWPRKQAPAYKGKNIQNAISGTVWATDEQHAVKIANETRIQLIAKGLLKP